MTNAIIQDIGRQIDKLYQEREDIENCLAETRECLEVHTINSGSEWMDNTIIKSATKRIKEIDGELQALYQEAIYQKLKLSLNITKSATA